MRIKNPIRFWVVSLVMGFALILGILLGKGFENYVLAESESYNDLRVFAEVLSMVQRNYVEEVIPEDLVYGAIRGMLNTLDPHSAFMPPDIYEEVQVDTRGEFGGLGIQISIRDGRLVVIAPIEETPAFRAGIQAGDFIVKVDDVPTKDMTLMEAVNNMRGPKGTEVTLSILREGESDLLDITLKREVIKIKSVKSEILEGTIGYIRLSQFQERTTRDLSKALDKLESEIDMEGLILDLRNNPGGLLTAAIGVSEQFLEPGNLIVYIKGRDDDKDEYLSKGKRVNQEFPIIILVNAGSASASEIVAGALQDWGRAVILGTQTFGKGSVQTLLPLSDGAGLRLTTARYYTPKGRSIQNSGIQPDIVVEPLPGPDGQQIKRLREKDLKGHLEKEGEEKRLENEKGPGPQPDSGVSFEGESSGEGDIQLQKAIDILKSWKIFKKLDTPTQVTKKP